MKQCTTSTHLIRTIRRLEHILVEEDYPAIRAAELLAITLLELAEVLPEQEEQIKEIVDLYDQCADTQYGPLCRRQHTKNG
jgi:hypothetical protein